MNETLGLLYLRQGNYTSGFQLLGEALPGKKPQTLLTAGSICQEYLDHQSALKLYRQCMSIEADSPELYNNIGMCY